MTRPAVTALALELRLDPYALLAEWGERAAMREYEGGYSRAEAERLALADVRELARERAERGAAK